MIAACSNQLFARIFRMSKCGHWQRRVGIRDARDVRVAQQWKNGMIKRRRGNFNLPGLRSLPVFWQHASKQLNLLVAQLHLVLLRKIHTLARQRRHHGIARQVFLIHPRKLRKHLKIAPVALAERLCGPLAALRTDPLVQLDIPRPARQQIVIIQLKRPQHDFGFIIGSEIGHRPKRRRKPRLIEFPAGVLFQLHAERRHNIERCMHPRKLLDHPYHAPIIF